MGSLSPAASPPSKQSKTLSRADTCHLDVLEQDHVALILRHLPPRSILSFAATCHRFRTLALGDSLWRHVYAREWGADLAAEIPAALTTRAGFVGLYADMAALNHATWHRVEQGGGVPRARASHSMAVLAGGKLVVFGGGSHGGRHLDDTWLAATDKLLLPGGRIQVLMWHRASTEGQPAGRFQQSCTVIKDKIVMFGGINDFGVRSDETWLFSVTDGREKNKGRESINEGEITGGKNNNGGEISDGGENNAGVSTWKQLSVVESPDARGAHAASYIGKSRIVVFGGIGNGGIRLGDTWILDLDEDPPTWRQVATTYSPQARSGHTLTWVTKNRVVLFGGRGANLEVLSDVWILDFNGLEPFWTRLETSVSHDKTSFMPEEDERNGYNGVFGPGPRAGHSATPILGGRVLIFGGEDGRRGRKCDVWVLDPNQRREEEGVGEEEGKGEGEGEREESEECQVPEWDHPKEGDLQVVPELMTEGGGGRDEKMTETECPLDASVLQGEEGEVVTMDLEEKGKEGEGESSEIRDESMDADGDLTPPPPPPTPVNATTTFIPTPIPTLITPLTTTLTTTPITTTTFPTIIAPTTPTSTLNITPTTTLTTPVPPPTTTPTTTAASTSTPPTTNNSKDSKDNIHTEETRELNDRKERKVSKGERREGRKGTGKEREGMERESCGVWRYVGCKGEAPERRSYHGACGMGGGSSVLVFGGMVDGEQQGHTAAGLTFDDQVFVLQLGRS